MDDMTNHRVLNRLGSEEHRNWLVQNFKKQIEDALTQKEKIDNLSEKLADKFIKLETERIRDPLTGAFNRALIGAVLKREIDLQTQMNSNLGFMIMDLDHFKSVNDEEPDRHSAGDRVLIEFTKILRQVCDSQKALVGRWGGEEFVIVLPQSSLEHLKEIAFDIGKTACRRLAHDAKLVRPRQTVSIGACLARSDDTAVGLIQRSDQLLYKAKEDGRNRLVIDEGDNIEVVEFK